MTQMRVVGRSILLRPARIYKMKINGIRAYTIDETPTDAVILGITGSYSVRNKWRESFNFAVRLTTVHNFSSNFFIPDRGF